MTFCPALFMVLLGLCVCVCVRACVPHAKSTLATRWTWICTGMTQIQLQPSLDSQSASAETAAAAPDERQQAQPPEPAGARQMLQQPHAQPSHGQHMPAAECTVTDAATAVVTTMAATTAVATMSVDIPAAASVVCHTGAQFFALHGSAVATGPSSDVASQIAHANAGDAKVHGPMSAVSLHSHSSAGLVAQDSITTRQALDPSGVHTNATLFSAPAGLLLTAAEHSMHGSEHDAASAAVTDLSMSAAAAAKPDQQSLVELSRDPHRSVTQLREQNLLSPNALTARDMHTLTSGDMVNDEIMNSVLGLFQLYANRGAALPDKQRWLFTSTFFMEELFP